jgi:hypothetical protein
MPEPQAQWNGTTLTATSKLVPKLLWQTASIDIFINGKCILQSGGQAKVTGSLRAQFEHEGQIHGVKLTWGRAALRSFPIEVSIDDQPVLKSRVFTKNWPLTYLPWLTIFGLLLYSGSK